MNITINLTDAESAQLLNWLQSFNAHYPSEAQRLSHQTQTYMRITYKCGVALQNALEQAEKPQGLSQASIK